MIVYDKMQSYEKPYGKPQIETLKNVLNIQYQEKH